ncbi:MAG: hypothetical protein KDI82_01025 [Gammaproteobacteria bacterium]|nr:hypothetical protein [Gammaproteobacteria bacterium]
MRIKDIVILVGVAAGIYFNLVFQDSLAGSVGSDWQADVLNHPTEAQLAVERSGRVVIYDGLTNRQVDQALDQQFDRIDAMMFVRTRHPQPQGGFESDDDCD